MKTFIISFVSLILGIGNLDANEFVNFLEKKGEKDSKFNIGLKGGPNFSSPGVIHKYQVFGETSQVIDGAQDKIYDPFYRNLGYQYSFVFQYNYTEKIKFTFYPTISHYNLKYSSMLVWESQSNPDDNVTMTFNQKQYIQYLELPLAIKYILRKEFPRPYIQAGIYYGIRQQSLLTSEVTEEVGTNTVNNSSSTSSISNIVTPSRFAISGGAGYEYELKSGIILFGEVNYTMGLHNITNESSRYADQSQLGVSYDITDDLRLNNLSLNIGILFSFSKPNLYGTLYCK